MITHEQFIFALTRLLPGVTAQDHGVKYWVAMPVDGSDQSGPAFIVESRDPVLDEDGKQVGTGPNKLWKYDFDQPTAKQVESHWKTVKNDFLSEEKAANARAERNQRLTAADALVARALDAGDTERVKALGKYRQALRDLPQQAGFPTKPKWPNLPE